MTTKFNNLVELTKHFPDEKACCQHLAQLRWDGTPACPHCGSTKVYKCKSPRAYICGEKVCGNRFSVLTGTFMEGTKISLSKWFIAMYLCFSHKKGVSSCQLARDLGVTQKTGWFMLMRIRAFVGSQVPEMLCNIVEVDETYIGGKEGNRHESKKASKLYQDTTFKERRDLKKEGKEILVHYDKVAVLGMVQRNGKVIAKHITDTTNDTIVSLIENNINKGTNVFTDEAGAYSGLNDKGYMHQSVNHSDKEYVRYDVSTNTIENFFSVLKRSIYGTYHQVSSKHMQKYLDEVAFKYSTRGSSEQERFDKALSMCDGRLKYPQLIQKTN